MHTFMDVCEGHTIHTYVQLTCPTQANTTQTKPTAPNEDTLQHSRNIENLSMPCPLAIDPRKSLIFRISALTALLAAGIARILLDLHHVDHIQPYSRKCGESVGRGSTKTEKRMQQKRVQCERACKEGRKQETEAKPNTAGKTPHQKLAGQGIRKQDKPQNPRGGHSHGSEA